MINKQIKIDGFKFGVLYNLHVKENILKGEDYCSLIRFREYIKNNNKLIKCGVEPKAYDEWYQMEIKIEKEREEREYERWERKKEELTKEIREMQEKLDGMKRDIEIKIMGSKTIDIYGTEFSELYARHLNQNEDKGKAYCSFARFREYTEDYNKSIEYGLEPKTYDEWYKSYKIKKEAELWAEHNKEYEETDFYCKDVFEFEECVECYLEALEDKSTIESFNEWYFKNIDRLRVEKELEKEEMRKEVAKKAWRETEAFIIKNTKDYNVVRLAKEQFMKENNIDHI